MKAGRVKLIFLLLFSIILSDPAFAGAGYIGINNGEHIKQDIKVYYVGDLKATGYDISGERYPNISSDQKDKVTTKLQAYLYKQGIGPLQEIKDATTTDKLFSPDKHGYYLLVLDKKNYEGKVLVSKPALIYYDGSDQMINIKSELVGREGLTDLNVILHWLGRVLDSEVWIGLHDEEGKLIGEAWLTADNNWRHMFFGLDPLKDYSIWVETIDGVFFTMNRVGNTIYIDNFVIKGPEDVPDDVWWPETGGPGYPIIPGGPVEDSKDGEDLGIGDRDEVDGEVDREQPEKDKGDGGEDGGLKPDEGKEKLPQTGLLWWPVPVLFALGLFFFIISFKEEKDE